MNEAAFLCELSPLYKDILHLNELCGLCGESFWSITTSTQMIELKVRTVCALGVGGVLFKEYHFYNPV
jgi:uncharacterized protein (DUF983 family)